MGKLAKHNIQSSFIILCGFLIGAISTLFIYPRFCSKEDLGIFRYVTNWGAFFGQLCTLGIGTAAIRLFYKNKETNSIGSLSAFLLIVPLVGISLCALFLAFFSGWFLDVTTTDDSLPAQAGLIVTSIIIVTVLMTYQRTYVPIGNVIHKTSAIFMVTEIIYRFLILGVIFLYYFGILDFTGYLLSICGVYFLQLVMVLFVIREYFSTYPLVMPKKEMVKPTIKLSLFCLIDSGAGMMVTQIDLIMISALCADSFVRTQEYSQAIFITTVVYLPWRSIINTTIPFVAEYMQKNDMVSLERIYQKSSLTLFLTGAALFTLIFPNIDNLIAMIPGDYTMIKYPVLFLCASKLIDMVSSINNTILSLSPYYRYNLYFNLVLIGIAFLTNWALIPFYGLTGSAIATGISLFLFNMLKGTLIYRKYGILPFHRKTLDVLLGLGIVFTVGLFIPDVFKIPFLNIMFRGAILFLLICIYLIWRKPSEDVEKVRINVFKRIPVLRKTV